MKDRYLWWIRKDVDLELRHAREEGRDLAGLQSEFDALMDKRTVEDAGFQRRVNVLMDAVASRPIRVDFPFVEPSDLEGIRRERGDSRPIAAELPADDQLRRRFHGAWLGRCAGCLLGKPLEGVRMHGMTYGSAASGRMKPCTSTRRSTFRDLATFTSP